MLGALIGYALFTGGCALATNLPGLTLMRALAGAASAGLIPVGMAYIGDAVPYEQRQVTLSKFLTGNVLAQVLAGPLGGIFGQYVGWRGVFLVLSGMAVVVCVVFALRIKHLPDRRAPGRMFKPENYVRMAKLPMGRLVLFAGALDGMLFIGCFPFLAPYLHERFGLSYAAVGSLLACFGVGAFVYTRLAPRLLRRLGEGGMVLAGGAMMTGALVLSVTTPFWQPFVLVQLMLGMGFFTLHSVLQAHATEILPQARATAVATFACLLFLGQSVGALAMGFLIGWFGYQTAFTVDALGIIGVTVWLWWMLPRSLSVRHG
jgi:predicted MFS family arabinose efflux permease